ncbi:MAG: TOBE domain-containing protein [Bacteroidetes bacterium]|nr:TOBE domain-containing protein [Bacteroidota bacterium]
MNQLLAEITEIKTSDDLALVKMKCEDEIFSSLIISRDDSMSVGKKVWMSFKETEVMLREISGEGISIKNRFASTIKTLQKGKLLCEVILNYKGHSITSIITSESCEAMNLFIGKEVEALVKTNDLMLIQHQ